MAALEITCKKCKISSTCPARGSSPLSLDKGKRMAFCRILDGYANQPIDDDALSEESKKRKDRDGPCLSLAEVPRLDEASGKIYTEIIKVFHHPIIHPRQTTSEIMDMMIPKNHATDKARFKR
ncbi:MAG TPA: hypothetical protein VIE65_04100 [Methylobacter sp.]|jgi:hypothetical protein